MIVLDFETTDLLSARPLDDQPYVIEMTMVKLDDRGLGEMDRFTTFVKPPIPIPAIVTKTTGLTDANVEAAKSFAAYYTKMLDMFRGEEILAGHNISYDHGVLVCELQRLGKEYLFPWPGELLCTMERTAHLFPTGKYPKLGELYQFLFAEEHSGAHRSAADVDATIRILRELRIRGLA